MTNAELLAKIKAEIERRIKECEATYPKDKGGYWSPEQEDSYAIAEEYKQLLSFLSTLEEQTKEVHNPIFDECVSRVDPEVREEVRENIDFEQALYDHFGQIKDFTLGMRIGKYFYELGCRRTAEKYDEIEYNRQREEEWASRDLKKEIETQLSIFPYTKVSPELPESRFIIIQKELFLFARHFAKWGAERFAKIVRENLPEIGNNAQSQFERLYFEITGTKMYGGYND